MKGIKIFFSLLILFLSIAPTAEAELPPFNPEMNLPDPETPKAQKLPPIYRGPFSFYTSQFSDGQSVLLKAATDFGFQLQNFVIPIFKGQKEQISTPNFEPVANFYTNLQYLQVPQQVSDKTIHNEQEDISSNIYCARIQNSSMWGKEQEDISSTGHQLSSPVAFKPELDEQTRKLNSLWGLHQFESITPGFYDFNRPTELNSVNDASGHCMARLPSTEKPEIENDVTHLSTFGSGSVPVENTVLHDIGEWIVKNGEKYFDFANMIARYTVYFTEVSVDSNAQQLCNVPDCTKDELDGTKHEWVKKLTSRGLAFAFIPEHRAEDEAIKDPEKRAAKSVYDYAVFGVTTAFHAGQQLFGEDQSKSNEHPYLIKGVFDYRSKQMACLSVPQEELDARTVFLSDPNKLVPPVAAAGNTTNVLAGAININDAIPINDLCDPTASPSTCSTDLSFLKPGSCKLCNTDKITEYTKYVHAGTSIPKTLQDILETVGNAFGVPPASLLSAMMHEGAFNRSYLEWTDAHAIEWAICEGTMPLENGQSCDQYNYEACGPGKTGDCDITIAGFGWRPHYFWDTEDESGNWAAVRKIDPSRTRETISPCNLLDAAAAAAKGLSTWGSFARTPEICYRKQMTSSAIAGSCSSSSWSDDKVLQSHIGYWIGSTAYCPDGLPEHEPPPPELPPGESNRPEYACDVLQPYHTFTCGMAPLDPASCSMAQ